MAVCVRRCVFDCTVLVGAVLRLCVAGCRRGERHSSGCNHGTSSGSGKNSTDELVPLKAVFCTDTKDHHRRLQGVGFLQQMPHPHTIGVRDTGVVWHSATSLLWEPDSGEWWRLWFATFMSFCEVARQLIGGCRGLRFKAHTHTHTHTHKLTLSALHATADSEKRHGPRYRQCAWTVFRFEGGGL
ncbi:hypothetical protein DQ04_03121020 [Trypanosoma grayi]|uniref:hypothetical protein n=1 Tax=Trypanosoma grayi TaxID=71804 RepID=UPI0004F446D2|nr:hypothetical protein DQ04_03121020 [Trypanosoma grayi]KEG10950.1 hypothetical protein DQ04_03121020 [Trypanosoma grayi]